MGKLDVPSLRLSHPLEKNVMEKERRSAPRVRVNLPAHWEGVLSRNEATITDLSRNGCFILSGGKVELKELISMEMEIPDRGSIHIWAEVVDAASEIGFAVKFNSTSDDDEKILAAFLEECFKSMPKKNS